MAKKIGKRHLQSGRGQGPASRVVDIFVVPVRDRRVSPGVLRMEEPEAPFYGHAPPFGEYPRIATGETRAPRPAVVAPRAAADEVVDMRELRTHEGADLRFVEPVAGAELRRTERGGKLLRAQGIPEQRSLQRPAVRQGHFGAKVQRRRTGRQGIGPHGEDLCRSLVGRTPQGHKQHRQNRYDLSSFHCLRVLFPDTAHDQPLIQPDRVRNGNNAALVQNIEVLSIIFDEPRFGVFVQTRTWQVGQ